MLSADPSNRWRGALALCFMAMMTACGSEAPSDASAEASLAACGSSLDVLLGASTDVEPSVDASYSEAVAAWPFAADSCGLAAFAGRCADGKRLLYRNGGFVAEIRYYDGEQLVGFVGSDDFGICPSVCPRSRFYGDIDSVRCESPVFEDLCRGSSSILDEDGLWMPFANGKAPGGCETP